MLERGENLSVLAYRRLREAILSSEFKPGERINEQHFSTANGLSRGPVREAIRMLERDGLVVAVKAKGVFVKEVSEKHLLEVYDLRAVITGHMCGEAARFAEKDDIARLERLNVRMHEAGEREDIEAYYAINLEFHTAIATIGRNETAHRVYDRLIEETHAHRVAVASTIDTIREHEAIVNAIARHDVAEARRLGEIHVMEGKRRWLKRRQDQVEKEDVAA